MFYLWAFSDYDKVVITRGRTQSEAWVYAQKAWRRGQTVTMENACPIDSKDRYDKNHAPGWLNRPPVWLVQKGD